VCSFERCYSRGVPSESQAKIRQRSLEPTDSQPLREPATFASRIPDRTFCAMDLRCVRRLLRASPCPHRSDTPSPALPPRGRDLVPGRRPGARRAHRVVVSPPGMGLTLICAALGAVPTSICCFMCTGRIAQHRRGDSDRSLRWCARGECESARSRGSR